MQLIRKVLFRQRPAPSGKNSKIRGLSTAELVGIIVIVGILGALGGTYITGLITQSKTNTGNQNAQSLTTTLASAVAGGANASVGATGAGAVDTTPGANPPSIAQLNSGVTVANNGTTITYQMNPPINTPASYTLTGNTYTYTGTAP